MPRLVAFLRAVNVGGRTVKMDALRAAFEALGLTKVETFIASGNVVFDSKGRDLAALERRIENALHASFGFEIDTFVRTRDEVAALAAHAAFEAAETTQVVGFLRAVPDAGALKTIAGMGSEVDRFQVEGRELFWLSSAKQSESVFSNAVFERALKLRTTFRGVGSLRKMVAKHGGG
ncbi:MAG TPA: DUF1697 domain-containing protein [Burkholderiaceae bacterium]|jgi:uncharacterized protein (DUF1697 family)